MRLRPKLRIIGDAASSQLGYYYGIALAQYKRMRRQYTHGVLRLAYLKWHRVLEGANISIVAKLKGIDEITIRTFGTVSILRIASPSTYGFADHVGIDTYLTSIKLGETGTEVVSAVVLPALATSVTPRYGAAARLGLVDSAGHVTPAISRQHSGAVIDLHADQRPVRIAELEGIGTLSSRLTAQLNAALYIPYANVPSAIQAYFSVESDVILRSDRLKAIYGDYAVYQLAGVGNSFPAFSEVGAPASDLNRAKFMFVVVPLAELPYQWGPDDPEDQTTILGGINVRQAVDVTFCDIRSLIDVDIDSVYDDSLNQRIASDPYFGLYVAKAQYNSEIQGFETIDTAVGGWVVLQQNTITTTRQGAYIHNQLILNSSTKQLELGPALPTDPREINSSLLINWELSPNSEGAHTRGEGHHSWEFNFRYAPIIPLDGMLKAYGVDSRAIGTNLAIGYEGDNPPPHEILNQIDWELLTGPAPAINSVAYAFPTSVGTFYYIPGVDDFLWLGETLLLSRTTETIPGTIAAHRSTNIAIGDANIRNHPDPLDGSTYRVIRDTDANGGAPFPDGNEGGNSGSFGTFEENISATISAVFSQKDKDAAYNLFDLTLPLLALGGPVYPTLDNLFAPVYLALSIPTAQIAHSCSIYAPELVDELDGVCIAMTDDITVFRAAYDAADPEDPPSYTVIVNNFAPPSLIERCLYISTGQTQFVILNPD